VQYRVTSAKDLDILLYHFDNYPLITQKWADYQLFKKAVNIFKNKQHLTGEGLKQIINTRASMNLGITKQLANTFTEITPVPRPMVFDTGVQDHN